MKSIEMLYQCLALVTVVVGFTAIGVSGCVRGNGTNAAGRDTVATAARTPDTDVSTNRGPESNDAPGMPSVAEVTRVSASRATQIGDQAPDFAWSGRDGREHSLAEFRGDVVVLNFWGTWCPPCRRELPDIVQLSKDYRAKGVRVIGVCLERVENPVQHVADFALENGLSYQLVISSSELADSYGGIGAVPTTFVVDRNGAIAEVMVGARGSSEFRAAVDKALRGS